MAEGERVAALQITATASSQAFGPNGDLFAARSYDKVETTLVFEYGAKDWLTLLIAPQFLSISLGGPDASSYNGPGYVDAGARMRLAKGETYVLSAQIVARAPGAAGSDSPAAIGYTDWEVDLRLLGGLSFQMFGKDAFLNVEAAQRQRSGAPPNEFRLDATLGVRVMPRWQMLVQSFNVISEGAGDPPVFGVSYEYYKAQLGFLYEWSAALTLQGALVTTYYARNAPQENGLTFAAFYRF